MSGPDFQPPGGAPPGGNGQAGQPPPGWQGPPAGGGPTGGGAFGGGSVGGMPPGGMPPGGPTWQPPPGTPPGRSGGSLLLGAIVGLVALFGGGWLFFAFADRLAGDIAAFVGLLLPVGYLIAAITLAVRPRTGRFGAGLLLAIGIALVILAGLCFGLLFLISGH